MFASTESTSSQKYNLWSEAFTIDLDLTLKLARAIQDIFVRIYSLESSRHDRLLGFLRLPVAEVSISQFRSKCLLVLSQ